MTGAVLDGWLVPAGGDPRTLNRWALVSGYRRGSIRCFSQLGVDGSCNCVQCQEIAAARVGQNNYLAVKQLPIATTANCRCLRYLGGRAWAADAMGNCPAPTQPPYARRGCRRRLRRFAARHNQSSNNGTKPMRTASQSQRARGTLANTAGALSIAAALILALGCGGPASNPSDRPNPPQIPPAGDSQQPGPAPGRDAVDGVVVQPLDG